MKPRYFLIAAAPAAIIVAMALTGGSDADLSTRAISGTSIQANLTEAGNVRIDGSDVTLSGRVDGTLHVRAAEFGLTDFTADRVEVETNTAALSGTIRGATILRAVNIRSDADLEGYVQLHTIDLDLAGTLRDAAEINMVDGRLSGAFNELTMRGNDVSFTRESTIETSLDISARDLQLDGRIAGELIASVRSIRLGGQVEGATFINAHPGVTPDAEVDGRVEIAGETRDVRVCAISLVVSGRIDGTLTVSTDDPPQFIGQGSASSVVYIPREDGRCRFG